MSEFITKLSDWWAAADLPRKAMVIGGAIVVVVVLLGIFLFASKPHMVPLYSGLTANDQANAVSELEKNGIKTEANEHGDILVQPEKLAEARMKLALANKLPVSGGFDDLDKKLGSLGPTETSTVERERIKGILEQRIAESIQSIEGITAARVHIVLAEDRAFITEAKPATASITLTQSPGAIISRDQARAIATLAANSVPGLTIANVAVLNNRMEMLFDGHDIETANGSANARRDAEDSESRKFAENLQRKLDQVYGPGSALVSVHLELDFDQKQSTVHDITPKEGIPYDKTTETMSGGGKPAVGGPSGAVANTQPGQPAANTPAPGSTTDNSYSNSHTSFVAGSTDSNTTKTEAPGSIKSMGINVIANSDKITDSQPLTDIIDGELGPKAGDPNFTRKITLVKFDTTAAKAEAAAATSAANNARIQQVISMLPMIALIGVGFFVLRQVVRMAKPPQVTLTDAVELPEALPGSTITGGIDIAGMEITPEALMEVNGGVLPKDVKINPQTGLVVLDGTENLSEEDRMRIVKGITTKVNVPLEQIKRMCQDRPEAVAMLIKGWLLEEKRA
jgi:flagellar M-ring protein FliF